jgi:hypothetical protein
MSERILLPNGAPPPDQQPEPATKKVRPALWVEYCPETQSVQVHVEPDQVKTWDFARALLTMAIQASERMAELQMARQAHAAMQDNALVDQVMRDLPRRR